MKVRCLNPKDTAYRWYGAKGIRPSKRWMKFENFRDDMLLSYVKHVEKFGEKNTTLDRKDSNGNYTLKNCRWATLEQQRLNQGRSNKITFRGVTKNCSVWAKEIGIHRSTLKRGLEKRERDLRSYHANKKHGMARRAVRTAIRVGEIKVPAACFDCKKSPPCTRSGSRGLVADHYLGYGKKNWLKVQFICASCDGIRRRKK